MRYKVNCPACGMMNRLTDSDLGAKLNCGSCGKPFTFGAEIVAERQQAERERVHREREDRKAADLVAKRQAKLDAIASRTPEQIQAAKRRRVVITVSILVPLIIAAASYGGVRIFRQRAEERRLADIAAAQAKAEADRLAAVAEKERKAREILEAAKLERESKRRDYVGLAEPMMDELRKSLSFVTVGLTLDDYRRRVQEITAAWNAFDAKTSDRNPPSKGHIQSCVESFAEALKNWEKKIKANRYHIERGEDPESDYTRELDTAMQVNWQEAGEHFKKAEAALKDGR